jgi:hypothetical protein
MSDIKARVGQQNSIKIISSISGGSDFSSISFIARKCNRWYRIRYSGISNLMLVDYQPLLELQLLRMMFILMVIFM